MLYNISKISGIFESSSAMQGVPLKMQRFTVTSGPIPMYNYFFFAITIDLKNQ